VKVVDQKGEKNGTKKNKIRKFTGTLGRSVTQHGVNCLDPEEGPTQIYGVYIVASVSLEYRDPLHLWLRASAHFTPCTNPYSRPTKKIHSPITTWIVRFWMKYFLNHGCPTSVRKSNQYFSVLCYDSSRRKDSISFGEATPVRRALDVKEHGVKNQSASELVCTAGTEMGN
jgi:hypothetical protein